MFHFRPTAFVLMSSDHGSLIVNRNDFYVNQETGAQFGIGLELFNISSFEHRNVVILLEMLKFRRSIYGDGVLAIDCGANIGVHTVEYARTMTGWGNVLGFEAQERLYYALAGNVALNNCFNATVILSAVGDEDGILRIPVPNYFRPMSFGSLELRELVHKQEIGQPINYAEDSLRDVRICRLDVYNFQRVDLIKIDVEGMDIEVLQGAEQTIERCKPVLSVEHGKVDIEALKAFLGKHGYVQFDLGGDILAIHETDQTLHAAVPILEFAKVPRIDFSL
jgi:FkbM family methyltransferase